MFSLVSGLWRWLTRKDDFKLLVVGIDNAGKTTTLEQIKRLYRSKTPALPLEKVTPTIGLNLCNVDFDRRTTLTLWDLGGQLMLRSIWENHYKECDGLFFVIDSSDKDRFAEVRTTIEGLVNHSSIRHQPLPVVLLINKQDSSNALPIQTVLQALNLPDLFADTQAIDYASPGAEPIIPLTKRLATRPFVPVAVSASALKNVNVDVAVKAAVGYIRHGKHVDVCNSFANGSLILSNHLWAFIKSMAAPVQQKDSESGDFWNSLEVPLRQVSEDHLSMEGRTGEPVDNSMAHVFSSGIDTSSLLSVKEVREKFSQANAPLLPKALFASPTRKHTKTRHNQREASPTRAAAAAASNVSDSATSTPPETAESSKDRRDEELNESGRLPKEEFAQLVTQHGCAGAVERFQEARTIVIAIRVDAPETNVLLREMTLVYHPEQRLLVMLRKSTARYLRLHEMTKIDGRDASAELLLPFLPETLRQRKPLTLHFATTPNPMVMFLSSAEDRSDLLKLIVFLRQFTRTDHPFEVIL